MKYNVVPWGLYSSWKIYAVPFKLEYTSKIYNVLEGKNCLQKDVGNRTQQSTKGLISNKLVEEMRTEQRLRGQEKSHVYSGAELRVREISMQTTM